MKVKAFKVLTFNYWLTGNKSARKLMKRQNLGTVPFMNDVSATKQHQILAMSMANKSLGDIKNE